MKSQINIRASALLQRQLEELTKTFDMSITETVAVAIDRMYQQEIGIMQNTPNDAQLAARRVDDTPALQPYRDLLIDYEWDNQDEHLAWVVTADTKELLSWARTIRDGELA